MMDLEKKYKVVFATCVERSLEFFVEKIGFEAYESIAIEGKECPVLQLKNGDFLMLVHREEIEQDSIVLDTDDCLRDYHLLKQKEVPDLTSPSYVTQGLSIEFFDPSGNRFILLEKRDYTDA